MALAEKYPMVGMTLQEWVETMLNTLSIDIGEILQTVEIDCFWHKMRRFKNKFDQEGAMEWLAKKCGYDSVGEMIDAQLDDYAYENSGVYDDD
ncbi:hypothetical protein [Allocoleopsis sp.]|uniref:hypothetical protein n=1 Tax=Allocoleopsis sp. TaxID=3088169 RepID=UPI002FD70AAF